MLLTSTGLLEKRVLLLAGWLPAQYPCRDFLVPAQYALTHNYEWQSPYNYEMKTV
jgi:hypothetical protein